MGNSHRLFKPFSLNLHGELHEYDRPQVMGIINVTPDSFYAQSRVGDDTAIKSRVEEMLEQGADMIDVGAYSSRPGADNVTQEEEIERLRRGLTAIRQAAPEIPVSVDTFRATVARIAVEELGADIINDISGGLLDPDMGATVASLRVPYVLMHMRGTPATMQSLTDYPDGNVTAGVLQELSARIEPLVQLGVNDIIVDPGFGFSKTTEQNYNLLRNLGLLQCFGRPVLAGMSRKSMITRPLGISPDQALAGTIAANTIALIQGASILRVHDVEAARHAVEVTELTIGHDALYTRIEP